MLSLLIPILITLMPPDSLIYPRKADTAAELELVISPPKNVSLPVQYRIDWGDGDTLDWTEPTGSMTPIFRSHRYRTPGKYSIRVMARDRIGTTSAWSRGCSVEVVPSLLKWYAPTLEPVVAAPALDEYGNVYIGDESGTLYSFNPAGVLRWTFQTRQPVFGGVTIERGLVFLPSLDSCLYCLDTAGNLKWSVNVGDEIWTPPAIGTDLNLYLTTDHGKLVSIDPGGKIRWQVKLGDEAAAAPTIGPDGNLYVSADSLYCFTTRGKRRWAFGTPDNSYFFAAPVLDRQGLIYAGSFDGYVYCLGKDGRLVWRAPVPDEDEIRTELVFSPDNRLYLGTDGYYLCVLEPGSPVRIVYETDDAVISTPAISTRGTVYLLSDDGFLYAFTREGTILFRAEVAAGDKDLYYTSSPAIGPDGTVYVGSWDGGLFAFYGDAPPADTPWPQFRSCPQHTGRVNGKQRRR
ncbi:MAG: PQQ-binding-like beta-propeller repeat protein [candidate division WOR-3 bacterium]|jgi:outer membrane protein assembly factor BamB